MNFNSPEFFFFLPVTLILYTLVFRQERLRDILLLCASYFFYMSWNWKYAGLLALSTVVDYGVGRVLGSDQNPARRKLLLIVSLVMNLGLLGLFKYFNFFMDVTADSAAFLGLNLNTVHHKLLLPVGISFYTFQTLSYTIDVYRKVIPVEKSLTKFALFVSFFPQLVAGPIVRAADFLPQLHRTPQITDHNVRQGMLLIFRGLFKKVVFADLLAALAVDRVFANPGAFSSLDLLMAVYGYAFQIYNDFSGYTDIAIGASRLFGYELTLNFNRPYLARNVSEFWRRWHISLSTWLRDYLYIPLGGNRGSPARVRFNLMMTMFLGGLWHGAALNFVFWGVWHGLLLIVYREFEKHKPAGFFANAAVQRLFCFHLIVFSWLLFRIDGWDKLVVYVKGLLSFTGGTVIQPVYFAILALAAASHFITKEWLDQALLRLTHLPVPVQALVYAALILIFTGVTLDTPAFIYFQF